MDDSTVLACASCQKGAWEEKDHLSTQDDPKNPPRQPKRLIRRVLVPSFPSVMLTWIGSKMTEAEAVARIGVLAYLLLFVVLCRCFTTKQTHNV